MLSDGNNKGGKTFKEFWTFSFLYEKVIHKYIALSCSSFHLAMAGFRPFGNGTV
jgi:hypothetical protein